MKRWIVAFLASFSMLSGCSESTGLSIGEERVSPKEGAIETEMIELIREISLSRRDQRGDGVVRRFNQPKTLLPGLIATPAGLERPVRDYLA